MESIREMQLYGKSRGREENELQKSIYVKDQWKIHGRLRNKSQQRETKWIVLLDDR